MRLLKHEVVYRLIPSILHQVQIVLIILFVLIAIQPLLIYTNSRFTHSKAKGVIEGSLAKCSARPNCYCINYSYGDTASDTEKLHDIASQHWKVLLEAVECLPRSTIVTAEDHYIHCESRSFYFGFIDDIELLHNEQDSRICFRSESRVGYSDLGVNKRRIEKLVRELNNVTSN